MTKAVALTAAIAMLASPSPRRRAIQPHAGSGLQITLSQGLYPSFDTGISDYVAGCSDSSPVQVTVNAPRNTKVSVDGQPFQKLFFTTTVNNLHPGQSFSLVVNSPGSSTTHYVRCLPSDFPSWKTERPSTPQAEYYVIQPNFYSGVQNYYIAVVDNYGVPMWWYPVPNGVFDAKLLPDGNMGWTYLRVAEERQFDGSLVRTISPPSPPGSYVDSHELQMLPNGDYAIIANVNRGPVDLSAYGGSATATVRDCIIEEIAPNGTLVWSWSAMDHLPISETDPQWRQTYLVNSSPADPFHMNSVEGDGNGFVASVRHMDTVFRVDKATGNITWKLSGVSHPESLTFVGDPYANFGGQHDARILPDGTLTVHDNGTNRSRPPRAVRYRLDLGAKTATLIEQVTDPDAPSSGCCGSVRKLASGDWVMSWGQNPLVTELTPTGDRIFSLTLAQGFSYRANPVPFGVLSRSTLRAGMDAQFPR